MNNSLKILSNSKNDSLGEDNSHSYKDLVKNNSKENQIQSDDKKDSLSNFELSELEYEEAVKYDKRTFFQIYFSLLKRKYKIILTFFIYNDYNLTYIKFTRFIFLVATDLAFNVFFFTDESMHKLFLNYGKYDFIQQIPQIIYSTIVSQLIEVFLCFLSLIDKYIYRIKKMNSDIANKKIVFKIFRCISVKLFYFFLFTFIFFLFYWYIVASFCAVYENTQMTFIKDSFSIFLLGNIYPFILYLFPTVFRFLAIREEKMRLK